VSSPFLGKGNKARLVNENISQEKNLLRPEILTGEEKEKTQRTEERKRA